MMEGKEERKREKEKESAPEKQIKNAVFASCKGNKLPQNYTCGKGRKYQQRRLNGIETLFYCVSVDIYSRRQSIAVVTVGVIQKKNGKKCEKRASNVASTFSLVCNPRCRILLCGGVSIEQMNRFLLLKAPAHTFLFSLLSLCRKMAPQHVNSTRIQRKLHCI